MEKEKSRVRKKSRCAQICMDRFEQNGNNETIVHGFHAKISKKKMYVQKSSQLEMRRQGIWRQFACSEAFLSDGLQ